MLIAEYSHLIKRSVLYQENVKKSRKINKNMIFSLYFFVVLFRFLYLIFYNKTDISLLEYSILLLFVVVPLLMLFSLQYQMFKFIPRLFLILNLFFVIHSLRSPQQFYVEIISISIYSIISYSFLKKVEAIIFNWFFFISCFLVFFPFRSFFELKETNDFYYIMLLGTFIIISIISYYRALEQKSGIENMVQEIFFDKITGLPEWQLLKLRLQDKADEHIGIFRICNFDHVYKSFGEEDCSQLLLQVKEKIENSPLCHGIEFFKLRGGDFIFLWVGSHSREDIEQRLIEIMNVFSVFSIRLNERVIYINAVLGSVPSRGSAVNILNNAEYAVELAELKHKPFILLSDCERPIGSSGYNKPFQVLLDCLEHDRVHVYYQPIVDLKTEVLVKAEALVRFLDSNGNLLEIAPLLRCAYSTGLNKNLTKLIIEKASSWSIENNCDVAINIGFEDLINSEVMESILSVLQNFKHYGRILTLEILESSGVLDTDVSFNNLLILRHSGAQIAIDDFGTGFANFDRVFLLQPDIIKFDGSLIEELPYSEDARYLISVVKQLADKNNIQTVAEHVSSPEILKFVRQYQIDHVQGFLFGKPSPENIFNVVAIK